MNNHEAPWLQGIVGDDARLLILSDESLIRVVAGPGSGKTTCLKRRTRRLIDGDRVDVQKVFVGTFTRAIAQELRQELGEEIKTLTLHSLAYELLRDNPVACQGMRLRFLLRYEEDSMLYDIAHHVPTAATQSERRRELLRLQSARAERQDYADAAFAGAVRNWLQRHGGMLIGEVVHLAVVGLESNDIPPGQFDHVVVDEYQDLTAAEQELIELVWSRQGSLVVMGDNDQSIYSFRFNHPTGVDEFHARWSEWGVLDLSFPDNRRCGDRILNLANLMMAEAGSMRAPMNPASGRPGDVHLVHWPDVTSEIEGLATAIKAKGEESFLVLVPRRFIGYRLKEAIGHDALTAFHEEVLQHQVAQERFALASALADPSDLVAIRSWLGFHGSQPQQADRRNGSAYASLPADMSGMAIVEQIASGEFPITGRGRSHLRRRAEILQQMVHEISVEPVERFIQFVFDHAFARAEPDDEKRRWLESDLTTLRVAALDIASDMTEPTLSKVMHALRYRIATRAPLVAEDEDPRVRIMTLHSAKGLEGDNIVLAGMADQFIPGLTNNPYMVAEQRRLLYVSVTRARDHLIVSWPRALPYADARANSVRNDGVVTISSERYVRLSRSSLLPQALPGGEDGREWLQRSLF